MKLSSTFLIFSLICSFLSHRLDSCTRMFWNNNSKAKIVARTMDLFIDDEPQMWITSRGADRQSKIKDNGLRWKSIYGSVVISAFHVKDLITDGMNEHGFAVHSLALRATQYEKRDHRPGIHYGEWLQYLLDTCQTVEEAINAHQHFQVTPIPINDFVWPLHLMMEDATGDSAIIEFVEGKMKVYHSSQYRVGTNDPTYDQQLNNLACYENCKDSLSLPTQVDSVSRFIRASVYLQQLPEPLDIDQAIGCTKEAITRIFQNNESIVNYKGQKLGVSTLWTVILDLTHRVYYFFPMNQTEPIRIDFSELNFLQEGTIELTSLLAISQNL